MEASEKKIGDGVAVIIALKSNGELGYGTLKKSASSILDSLGRFGGEPYCVVDFFLHTTSVGFCA